MRVNEHLAAMLLILFFVPVKANLGGIELYLADLFAMASIAVLAINMMRGKIDKESITTASFIWLFMLYILFSGLINQAPTMLIIIEMIQWASIAALLTLYYQSGLFASPRFLSTLALYAFAGATYTALWHLAQPDLRDFKHLANMKYLFGFTCVLLILLREHIRFSHVLLAITAVFLLLSGERKAWLAVAAMLITTFFVKHARNNRHLPITGCVIIVIAAALLATMQFSDFTLASLVDDSDLLFADQIQAQWDSDLWRRLLLANGFALFLENPALGVGAKMLPFYITPYFENPLLATYTHNFVLDVAIEYGVMGHVVLLGGYFLGIARFAKQYPTNALAFPFAIYAITTALFAAVNSTIMIIFLMPFFLNTKSQQIASTEQTAAKNSRLPSQT